MNVDDVLRFWFEELEARTWWNASDAVDLAIRERFAELHETLVRRPPAIGALDARGHLAAVIVLDQLPRHLFRGDARAFASDAQARVVANHAIDRRLDVALPLPQRHFLYMPLMHREDLATQQRALALFAQLDGARALHAARRHHDEIERFGRFPARNAALGRESTDEERRYLGRATRDGRRAADATLDRDAT